MKEGIKMKKDIYQTIIKIDRVKKCFEKEVERRLGLVKVECPLFVSPSSGLQDQLSGSEKAVEFSSYGEKFQVVHSLAKWKRLALERYFFEPYTGIYTDMCAVRKEETIDDLHSLYVEQWDWEKVILRKDRTVDYLKETVRAIYKSLRMTAIYYKKIYPEAKIKLPKTVSFITSQKLEDLYPEKTPKEREYLISKEKGAVFIMEIGDKLKSGKVHNLRSPDYDDWCLDGDLFVYDKTYDREIEISSMGIRVDRDALLSQLEKSQCKDRISQSYHQKIIKDELPYTIGGGIGKSRIFLFILGKKHIAEVQASSWPSIILDDFHDKKLDIL